MATVDRHAADTLVDLVPSISSDEADLLVAILDKLIAYDHCSAGEVCNSWALVQVAVNLCRRKMIVIDGDGITLTELGEEWAEAFSRFSPNTEASDGSH